MNNVFPLSMTKSILFHILHLFCLHWYWWKFLQAMNSLSALIFVEWICVNKFSAHDYCLPKIKQLLSPLPMGTLRCWKRKYFCSSVKNGKNFLLATKQQLGICNPEPILPWRKVHSICSSDNRYICGLMVCNLHMSALVSSCRISLQYISENVPTLQ